MSQAMSHPGEDAELSWPDDDDAPATALAAEPQGIEDPEDTADPDDTDEPLDPVLSSDSAALTSAADRDEAPAPDPARTDTDIPDEVADILAGLDAEDRSEPDAAAPSADGASLSGVPSADALPLTHAAVAGHTLCLVVRLVYPATGDAPLAYLSAAVDHQLPQSTAPLAVAQLGTLPPDLVALGQVALTRFASAPPPRAAAPAARTKAAKAAGVPPVVATAPTVVSPGPRPTPPPPLPAGATRQAQQLDLFAVAPSTPHE